MPSSPPLAPPVIDAGLVRRLSPMEETIDALRTAFQESAMTPVRHAHEIADGATLLLMPAWSQDRSIGVKVATVHRDERPAVKASYLLIDARTGALQAMMDGSMLTPRRTAAASALAASYLARHDTRTMLMVGTGTLSEHLIEAHRSVRPIERVLVWGRDGDKARAVAERAGRPEIDIAVVADLDQAVGEADLISVATLSSSALIAGRLVRPGTHVDLVGAFRHDMCEADPECFARARVFVDTRDGALAEAGDLLQAIEAGAMAAADVEAELADLTTGRHAGRGDDDRAITLFKSVGASIEDLAAAELIYRNWQKVAR